MKTAYTRLASAFITAALLTGCGKGFNIKVDMSDYKEKLTGNITVDLGKNNDISAVGADIDTGGITFIPSDNDIVSVDIDYNIFADDISLCQEIADHISASGEEKNGRFDINVIEKDSGSEFGKWIKDKGYKCRVEINTEISAPSCFESFDAKVKVGNITFRQLSGCFSGYAEVGNITCSGDTFTAPSEIECYTGNITMTDCSYCSDTSIKADTGNIAFGLPKNGSKDGSVGITVNTGNIDFKNCSEYTSKKGDPAKGSIKLMTEGCNVSASVKSGNISIDKE